MSDIFEMKQDQSARHSRQRHNVVEWTDEVEIGRAKEKKDYQNDLKQCALIDLHEVCIPSLDFFVGLHSLAAGRLGCVSRILDMEFAVFNHLGQNFARHIGKWNLLARCLCKVGQGVSEIS